MTQVLIVEDDPMVAMLNQTFIEKFSNMKIIENVRTASEARKIIELNEIDLLLLDIFLPGDTGIELLSWIRMSKKENIAVILITAADDVGTVKAAIRYGAIDYLIKPFTFERFQFAVEKYLKLIDATQGNKTDQSTLDRYLNASDSFNNETTQTEKNRIILPKGLTKLTLKRVYQGIETFNETLFSTKELSIAIQLSRISTKKYLQFLVDCQFLEEVICYLEMGRPLMKYKVKKENQQMFSNYFTD
ncbi:response regulator [Melissococcus plutonius]|uniref:response regulator n=2 Tax=Melissococcus plutonius TaxID=33970 RepID=UPI00065E4B1D|nr:response regulator [Melissococcus plutonius]AIM25484.1 transcriptional regulatory protein MalR [Melissococcus plutonius S1]KMT25807.1 transcriptional regulatory protein MalR [Melissococcus plutonius]KMT27152.1 transcriptional regulatory protein MalR [Melissococcus plutonius]KMT28253.1 transcriptional regulatory protein MalR [Melissococcus plutonius]KMT29990.1 transcriptional regulatory protein MalR [Melissococcus plutonius]